MLWYRKYVPYSSWHAYVQLRMFCFCFYICSYFVSLHLEFKKKTTNSIQPTPNWCSPSFQMPRFNFICYSMFDCFEPVLQHIVASNWKRIKQRNEKSSDFNNTMMQKIARDFTVESNVHTYSKTQQHQNQKSKNWINQRKKNQNPKFIYLFMYLD